MQHTVPAITVSPLHYNIHLPLQTNSRGLVIPVYWGTEKNPIHLNVDNHSPTWANNNLINGNPAIVKSKYILYSTTTADGRKINGDVYLCDSIRIGNLSFKNLQLYNISNEANADKPDGVIGEDIMRKAIWKIDFKNQQIGIASSPESVQGWAEAVALPAVFTSKAVAIEVVLGNAVNTTLELDLGYNGAVIIPASLFKSVVGGKNNSYRNSMDFSTPSGTSVVDNVTAKDSIRIGQQRFMTLITTNDLVKEKLLGLGFFSQFEFVIIDYLDKTVYVSKNKLH